MRILFLLLAIFYPTQVFANQTQKIETKLFSIDIPSNWTIIHEEKRQFLFANSKDSYDGWPTQMLIIDYCEMGGPQKEKNTIQCTTCSENTLIEKIKKSKTGNGPYSISSSKNGNTEEFEVANFENNEAKISKLICGKNGQVFLELMTSKKPTKEFLQVLETIEFR